MGKIGLALVDSPAEDRIHCTKLPRFAGLNPRHNDPPVWRRPRGRGSGRGDTGVSNLMAAGYSTAGAANRGIQL